MLWVFGVWPLPQYLKSFQQRDSDFLSQEAEWEAANHSAHRNQGELT